MPDLLEPLEIEAELPAAVSARHRVLIAATVTAVLGGNIRIGEIRPVATPSRDSWAKGRIPFKVVRAVARPCVVKVRPEPARKAKKREIANHA
jgi:hypothetical protein